jgi:hypothetical protein
MRVDRGIRRIARTAATGLACFWFTAGCSRSGDLAPFAVFGAQDASAPASPTITVEFDAPPSVETKGSTKFALHAVQIVVVSSSRTLQSVTVERDQWQIVGDKAHVSFQLASVPRGSNPVRLRLRFLSDGPAGEWSAATSELTAPETAEVPRAPRRQRTP